MVQNSLWGSLELRKVKKAQKFIRTDFIMVGEQGEGKEMRLQRPGPAKPGTLGS
jgi:hypothetical protein